MIVTLNREMNEEVSDMSCVACRHLFSFRVVRKVGSDREKFDSISEMFGNKRNVSDVFNSIFGGFEK